MSKLLLPFLVLALPAIASPDAGVQPVRIAVLPFDALTTDAELAVFGKGLAAMMISDLAATTTLDVVERDRLEAVLAELKLGQTKAANQNSFAQMGKLLGAQFLVTGTLLKSGKRTVLMGKVFSVEQALIIRTAKPLKVFVEDDDVMTAEQAMVEQVTQALAQVKVAYEVRAAPQKQTATKLPLKAGVLYGKALDAKDKHDTVTATKLMGDVLKAQPDFKLAQLDLLSLTK